MRKFAVYNNSGYEIPPYGIAKIDSLEGTQLGSDSGITIFNVVRPDGNPGTHVVNGSKALASGSKGTMVHLYDAKRVATGGGTYFGGQTGPGIGTFLSQTTLGGLKAIGQANAMDVQPVRFVAPRTVPIILAEALTEAQDPLLFPSTALARVLVWNAAGELLETAETITITHRYQYISAEEGTFGEASERGPEWWLTGIDCNPVESGD